MKGEENGKNEKLLINSHFTNLPGIRHFMVCVKELEKKIIVRMMLYLFVSEDASWLIED